MEKYRVLFNALGFQIAWWASMIGAINGIPLLGPAIMSVYLLIHLQLSPLRKREIFLIAFAGIFGTTVDSIFSASGLIRYSGGFGVQWLAPLWITFMWVGFSATLNHSLKWLADRPFLAFGLGAVFGPLAYTTGTRFEALHFNASQLTVILVLAAAWGISIPILNLFSKLTRIREAV